MRECVFLAHSRITTYEVIKVTAEIVNVDIPKLIELAVENGIEFDEFEGNLQDNYIFYGAENISIEEKSAKYIVVKETYLNCWSSGHTVIMTDSYEDVQEHLSAFQAD